MLNWVYFLIYSTHNLLETSISRDIPVPVQFQFVNNMQATQLLLEISSGVEFLNMENIHIIGIVLQHEPTLAIVLGDELHFVELVGQESILMLQIGLLHVELLQESVVFLFDAGVDELLVFYFDVDVIQFSAGRVFKLFDVIFFPVEDLELLFHFLHFFLDLVHLFLQFLVLLFQDGVCYLLQPAILLPACLIWRNFRSGTVGTLTLGGIPG